MADGIDADKLIGRVLMVGIGGQDVTRIALIGVRGGTGRGNWIICDVKDHCCGVGKKLSDGDTCLVGDVILRSIRYIRNRQVWNRRDDSIIN